MMRIVAWFRWLIGDGVDLCFILGLVSIVAGMWEASRVAGLITLGIALLFMAAALSLRSKT